MLPHSWLVLAGVTPTRPDGGSTSAGGARLLRPNLGLVISLEADGDSGEAWSCDYAVTALLCVFQMLKVLQITVSPAAKGHTATVEAGRGRFAS